MRGLQCNRTLWQQETDTEQKGGEGLRLSFIFDFDEQRKETPYEDTY